MFIIIKQIKEINILKPFKQMYKNSYCTIKNHKNVTDLTHIGHIFSTQRQNLTIHKNTSYIIHVYYYVYNHKVLTTKNRSPAQLSPREGVILT